MRKTDNWLTAWMEYSSAWEAPERFRLWSGVAAISGVLQRKVYTFVKGQRLHANTYILLVGPPGSGKGNAMKYLANWLKDLDGEHFKMAPDGLTNRSFYVVLEAARTFPGGVDSEQHALTAFLEELGVFLHAGDSTFIYSLCHIYDCPPKFHYKTAHAGENSANNASFSMLAACTPRSFREIFTEDVMELGISARTVIVFADDKVEVPIFGKRKNSDRLAKDLQYDIRRMLEIEGEYQFVDEAAEELVRWSETGFAPKPKDPRFEHYNSRRFVQILKLCMVMAASKRDDTIITLEDINEAKSVLLECEAVMPRAIETLGTNPLLAQQRTAIKLISTIYETQGRGTDESELYKALARDVPPHLIKDLLEYIANAKWVAAIGSKPNRKFFPRGKESTNGKKKPVLPDSSGNGSKS